MEEDTFEFDITDFKTPQQFEELFNLSMKYQVRVEIRDDRVYFSVWE